MEPVVEKPVSPKLSEAEILAIAEKNQLFVRDKLVGGTKAALLATLAEVLERN